MQQVVARGGASLVVSIVALVQSTGAIFLNLIIVDILHHHQIFNIIPRLVHLTDSGRAFLELILSCIQLAYFESVELNRLFTELLFGQFHIMWRHFSPFLGRAALLEVGRGFGIEILEIVLLCLHHYGIV